MRQAFPVRTATAEREVRGYAIRVREQSSAKMHTKRVILALTASVWSVF